MRQGMTLQNQIFLGILIALTCGYLLRGGWSVYASAETPPTPSPTPAATQALSPTAAPVVPSATAAAPTATAVLTPKPFVTLPGVWMARVTVNRGAAPVIERVTALEQGRITAASEGENLAEVLDLQKQVMYSVPFKVSFQVGEPPQQLEAVTLVLMLPKLEGEKYIRIQTAAGEAIYELE